MTDVLEHAQSVISIGILLIVLGAWSFRHILRGIK